MSRERPSSPAVRARRVAALLAAALLCASLAVGAAPATTDRAALGALGKRPAWQFGNVTLQGRSKPAGVAPVVFPHWSHRARYACRVCHVELGFSMGSGQGSEITRKRYLSGEFCGACHNGKIAFSVQEQAGECDRCHLRDLRGLERRFEAFSRRLPGSAYGNGIDWTEATKRGLVQPVLSLDGRPPMALPQNLKKPIRLGTTSAASDVVFSHEEHSAELDCSSCHPDLFNIQTKGTRAFTMASNIFGEFCGACHMRVAFPMNDCARCHSQMSPR